MSTYARRIALGLPSLVGSTETLNVSPRSLRSWRQGERGSFQHEKNSHPPSRPAGARPISFTAMGTPSIPTRAPSWASQAVRAARAYVSTVLGYDATAALVAGGGAWDVGPPDGEALTSALGVLAGCDVE